MSSRSPDRPVPGQPAADSTTPGRATLIGRAVMASIGEPWDFTSSAGDNMLTGRIVALSPPDAAAEWLICDVSPFTVTGGGAPAAQAPASVSTVAAVRRYAGEEPIGRLLQHGEAHVHLLYDPSGAPLTAEQIDAAVLAAPADRSTAAGPADRSPSAQAGLRHLIASFRLA